ncbi:Retinitis pigmentosa 9 protein [Ophiophagus hannah]|uniref:Retinitis pigmentosa 9 protein n=1 Tax=Ophiophagus hannah TaxID=8665 RepID=V8NCX7_OPHHA|nr:Retinitis pigmentosa 9 protein [Ophiophagus hannah]
MSQGGRQEETGTGSTLRKHRNPSESLPSCSSQTNHKGQDLKEQKRNKRVVQQIQQIQHLESFYEKLPPGLIKENETKPEDCIPDVPGNENAREFLAHAPTKGLWMPLGKEVKAHEDPMYDIIRENKRYEKDMRIEQLKRLLEDSTSDEVSSNDSSSSSESRVKHKKKKKKKEKKKKKKKRKRRSSKSSKKSESD